MRTLSIIIVAALSCSTAFAELSPDQKAKAAADYEAGVRAFRLGDLETAIKMFKESYQISGSPLLLYNMAQAYRQRGDSKQALFFYKQFLAEGGSGHERAIAQKRVAELETALEQQQKAQEAPPQGPSSANGVSTAPVAPTPDETRPSGASAASLQASAAPPERKPPIYKRPWFWGAVIGGAVVVAVGVGLGVGLSRPPAYLSANPTDGTVQF